MLRIAHTSDLHIDERGRMDDVRFVLRSFLQSAAEREVDLIVIAGDHFERRSTPAERVVLADFLQSAAEIAPVFAVRGNHDQLRDLEVFSRLETKHPLHLFERPTAEPESAPFVHLMDASVGLIALPWFDKAHLVAGLDAEVDQEMTRHQTIGAARALLTCLRTEATRIRAAGAIPILAGHVMVAGSEVSTGQTLIGTTVELSPADLLEVGAAYAALGHIHMHQLWHGGRVAYSGSPHRCNHGETERKGYLLATLDDDGSFVSNEFVELPARRMVHLEADLTDIGAAPGHATKRSFVPGFDPEACAGALVRFRYRVRAEDLHLVDVASLEMLIRQAGAEDVKLEAIVQSETRARAPEIVTADTLPEKLDAYLQSKSIEVDEPTRSRLHAKLGVIEREVIHAAA
jgi:DNA repair protein SbcD/Mre11